MSIVFLIAGIVALVWGAICLGIAVVTAFACMKVKQDWDDYRPSEQALIAKKSKGLPLMFVMSLGIIAAGIAALVLRS